MSRVKLKNNQLHIYYSGDKKYSLDESLRKILRFHGYCFINCGFDIEYNVRELAFKKKGAPK